MAIGIAVVMFLLARSDVAGPGDTDVLDLHPVADRLPAADARHRIHGPLVLDGQARTAWMMPEQLRMFVVRLVGAVFVVVGGLLVLSPMIWSGSSGSTSDSVMAGGVMVAIGVVAIGFALTRSRS